MGVRYAVVGAVAVFKRATPLRAGTLGLIKRIERRKLVWHELSGLGIAGTMSS